MLGYTPAQTESGEEMDKNEEYNFKNELGFKQVKRKFSNDAHFMALKLDLRTSRWIELSRLALMSSNVWVTRARTETKHHQIVVKEGASVQVGESGDWLVWDAARDEYSILEEVAYQGIFEDLPEYTVNSADLLAQINKMKVELDKATRDIRYRENLKDPFVDAINFLAIVESVVKNNLND